VEIVSEPDIRSPKEAGAYLRKLHSIVKYINVCDGNMEQGSFRCDANISLRLVGEKKFGTRTELKNLNSFRHVEKALQYEIERQQYLLENGKEIVQETRLWDPEKNRTTPMRSKEEAHDYRYFPEPDLVPLIVDDKWIEREKENLPELPDARRTRFVTDYGITAYDAEVLTSARELADYFEEAAQNINDKKLVCHWVMGPVLGMLKSKGTDIGNSPVKARMLGELAELIEKKTITAGAAKTVFEEMVASGRKPVAIVKEKGLEQVSDNKEIEKIINQIIEANPAEVEAYKNGKTKLFGFFMGQIMKQTKGKADPGTVTKLLMDRL